MRYITLLEKVIDHQGYNLDAKFAHYNRLCFDGVLPKIPLKFSVLKGAAGVCKYKTLTAGVRQGMSLRQKRQLPTRLMDGSLRIILDRKYLRSEEEIDAILVHEMIHAWFAIQGDYHENHGSSFLRKLRECEAKTGLKIPVTERVAEKEIAADIPDVKLIVILQQRDGREPVYAVVNPTAFSKAEVAIRHQWWNSGTNGNLLIFEITSPLWTAHSFRVPVQRPLSLHGQWVIGGRSRRGSTKFFYMRNRELLDDLMENGKLLMNLKGDLG
jgi:hypothetical protein